MGFLRGMSKGGCVKRGEKFSLHGESRRMEKVKAGSKTLGKVMILHEAYKIFFSV